MSTLLEQASLVMIPSGYKEDIVYSQIPTNGNGDLTFTRASNGTRVNSAGLVEVVPWNLCTYSEQFQNADWLGGGNGKPTMTDNFAEAPNGTMTASKMEAASDGYQLRQNNAQENTQMNLSVWLRTNTGTKTIQLFMNNASTASQNITVTTTWTRYEISGLVTTLAGGGRNGLNTLEALTSSNYILVWGFQLSVGLTAKPYFPTTDRLNVPRLTYQNSGGGCPSLLLEKQSTNGVYPSEDFTNANWQNYGGASVTANTAISPDGTQNADTLDSGTSTALYNPNGVSGGAIPFTASIYVKKVNFQVFRFGMTDDTLEEFSYNYNLDTGAISAATTPSVWTSTSGTITSVGNGWYRLTVTGTKGVSGAARMVVKGQSSSKQYYIWGAQLEASSYATSYIPTTSSSATRVADACYKTGISSLIGQTEGVIFYDGVLTGISNAYANLINGEKNTTGSFSIGQRNTGAILCGFFVGGSSVVTFDAGSYAVGTRTKIAFAYKSGSSVLYVNGSQLATSTATFTPIQNIDDIFIGDPTTFFNYKENTQVNQVAIFPTRLTNAELASLTTI